MVGLIGLEKSEKGFGTKELLKSREDAEFSNQNGGGEREEKRQVSFFFFFLAEEEATWQDRTLLDKKM